MAKLIDIPVFKDTRGDLSVIEQACPFSIRRVFSIFNVPRNERRGEHGHIRNRMLLTSLKGSCSVFLTNGKNEEDYLLNSPDKGLLIEPDEWHRLSQFKDDCVLLVCCSEKFDKEDYFHEMPND